MENLDKNYLIWFTILIIFIVTQFILPTRKEIKRIKFLKKVTKILTKEEYDIYIDVEFKYHNNIKKMNNLTEEQEEIISKVLDKTGQIFYNY